MSKTTMDVPMDKFDYLILMMELICALPSDFCEFSSCLPDLSIRSENDGILHDSVTHSLKFSWHNGAHNQNIENVGIKVKASYGSFNVKHRNSYLKFIINNFFVEIDQNQIFMKK
ncbi:hypothetical protein RF11_09435 [Thelohanellus kitauei]|uniref:Uncharacterized protein n=1 Tax=Thelohanellus kitauei TaxID=669202 RepID=A0A0C2NAQ2_THEKT|nr:hypothetical protein RF11_09431 [Thelohanellus kitauei]KII73445.1 hypothetical protein RF11_09435 [Thelohanellus kitauei]